MEPLLAAEVGRAVTGMSRREVNEIVVKSIEQYEDQLGDPPLGMKYQECFDIASRRPGDEAMAHYRQARQNLANWGVAFEDEPFYY
jgi:hypothetical protein